MGPRGVEPRPAAKPDIHNPLLKAMMHHTPGPFPSIVSLLKYIAHDADYLSQKGKRKKEQKIKT
jgi:hypothetical protein